jgi:glyoxylase-like metal-dependent hydrolase (beta-lactamase superfamily II)
MGVIWMKEQEIISLSFGMVQVFLIKGDKNILVDTGLSGKFARVVEELEKNNVDPKSISLIVCTHNHGDHVGEVCSLKELTGAKVAIHRSEAESLSRGKSIEATPTGLFGKVLSKFFGNHGFKPVKADVLVDNELRLDEFGVKGRLIHTPGHTPGSITVVLDNGSVIVGDMFSGKKSGEEYKATLPIFAADLNILRESMKKVVKLAPKRIYNSHGVPVDARAVEKLIEKMEK